MCENKVTELTIETAERRQWLYGFTVDFDQVINDSCEFVKFVLLEILEIKLAVAILTALSDYFEKKRPALDMKF